MRVSEVTAVLFCDDIRKEIANKETLVGVYTGDIVLPAFPSWFGAAIWLEMSPTQLGRHEIEFRISLAGIEERPPIEAKLVAEVAQEGMMSAALTGLQFLAEAAGSISIEMKEGDEWHLLKQKKILMGAVVP